MDSLNLSAFLLNLYPQQKKIFKSCGVAGQASQRNPARAYSQVLSLRHVEYFVAVVLSLTFRACSRIAKQFMNL